jgi:hypothetical protein
MENKVEKTTIVLEDDQAAVVINENGGIFCHIPKHDPDKILEPHELIILAISFKFAHDPEELIRLCSKWIDEAINNPDMGSVLKQVKLN